MSHRYLILLTTLLFFVSAPLMLDLPLWVFIAMAVFVGAKWIAIITHRLIPNKNAIAGGLAILSSLIIFYQYETFLDQEAGASLLLLMMALKFLELDKYRDYMSIILFCFYVLMSKLLFDQSVLTTLYLLFCVFFILFLLFETHFQHGDRSSLRQSSKIAALSSAKLLIVSLPLLAVLFVFFPRLEVNFWNLKRQSAEATGFSDDLNPGDIEKIVMSQKPAFQVQFPQQNVPNMDKLYWRGSILWHSQGLNWKKFAGYSPSFDFQYQESDLGIPRQNRKRQIIVLEPHFNKWLFALDYPLSARLDTSARVEVEANPGQILTAPKVIHTRTRYEVESAMDLKITHLTEHNRRIYLQLPDEITPRTHLLVEEWLKQANTPKEILQQALSYFSEGGFRYTLQPGKTQGNALDDFLFNLKKGYCEHYAGALATLMRIAKVPSRVVIGFQGGIYNQYSESLMVTNQDAHAWAEVYLDDEGWVRVDPTQNIAPLRLSLGGQEFMRLNLDNLDPEEAKRLFLLSEMNTNAFAVAMQELNLMFQAFANKWDLFLLNYNFEFQQFLLSQIGFANLGKSSLFLIMGFFCLSIILTFLFLQKKQVKIEFNSLERQYSKLVKKLSKQGLAPAYNEPPLQFAERALTAFPAQKDELEQIFVQYLKQKYGPSQPTPQSHRLFKKNVQKLRLPALDQHPRSRV